MTDFGEMIAGAFQEFGKRIEQYAGKEVLQNVIRPNDQAPTELTTVEGALYYKEAIDRLDKLADKPTCQKIMHACGCTCQSLYDQPVFKAKELRQTYATEEEFLENFKMFDNGTRLERKGGDIIQRFNPGEIIPGVPGLRCACMLIGGLPKGTYGSPTVCECSRGFTEQRWETILGRPVEVEIISTPIINDSEECTFVIHL